MGIVALASSSKIAAVRAAMRRDEYSWINEAEPTAEEVITRRTSSTLCIHRPALPDERRATAELRRGMPARQSSISVDGDGNVKPCHFLKLDLGNLYDGTLSSAACRTLAERACNCFIG